MLAHYERMPSQSLGRRVHLWRFGHGGRPLLALPTAGGYAHEWQHHGVVEALGDLIAAGRVCVYQPETNVAEVWTHAEAPLDERMARHEAYERFIAGELIPRIWRETGRRDLIAMGASVGAFYAVNLALKFPERVPRAVGLSGRYRARGFTDGEMSDALYYSDPSSYVWGLRGEALQRVRAHTHITLVCGQGNYEGRCLDETRHLARGLEAVGAPVWADIWGHDVSHEWHWWRRQIRYHVLHRLDRW